MQTTPVRESVTAIASKNCGKRCLTSNQARWFWLLSLASWAVLTHSRAIAQTVPSLPPTSDPSRIQQQLQPPSPPAPRPFIRVPRREDLTAPPGADRQKFRLQELQIQGATVYSPNRLQKLYAQLVGKDISLSNLYLIANRITQLYRDDGYILSQAIVPAQTIRGGVAKIQVIEGFVERVDFLGATKTKLNRLKGFGNKIVASRPLNIKQLERYLLLANELAGIRVRGVLSPGRSFGGSILTLNVNYKPTNTFIDLNNRGSSTVGPL